MTSSAAPKANLSHLHRADGSGTFSHNGYTVIAAVNGPIEAQRRDELPEEAAVEVLVRPAAGVGGTRERHLESILQSTLRQIILIHSFPRSLIQVTLQITSTPESETTGSKVLQASSVCGYARASKEELKLKFQNLPILPILLQASVLALLSASMPLATIFTSVLLAITSDGGSRTIVRNPNLLELQSADSVHVLAFTSNEELLVAESEGSFIMEDWDEIYDLARTLCCGSSMRDDDLMQDEDEVLDGQRGFVKSIVHEKVAIDLHWKD